MVVFGGSFVVVWWEFGGSLVFDACALTPVGLTLYLLPNLSYSHSNHFGHKKRGCGWCSCNIKGVRTVNEVVYYCLCREMFRCWFHGNTAVLWFV